MSTPNKDGHGDISIRPNYCGISCIKCSALTAASAGGTFWFQKDDFG